MKVGTSHGIRPKSLDVALLAMCSALVLSGCGGGGSSTPTPPDSTPPTAPANLTAAASASQINLAWTASTDNVGVTGYKVERCSGAACVNFAQIAAPTATSLNDTGLTASTSYSYRVRATDAAGNLSGFSNTASATTLAVPDTTPPTAPANLTATSASATQINLSWTASTDNVGVTGYKVERCSGAGCANFVQIAAPTATSFSDTGLTASTSYSYRVRANDAAGNNSNYSNTASATTLAGPDTTPPTAPTNLAATSASATQINLAWTASTDNVGVTGYKVERCSGAGCVNFSQIATPTTTSLNDTGLTASTSYSYRVRANDAAGNNSNYSNTASATTLAGPDTTPPTAPANLTATSASATQINLAWTASTDNVGVTGYKVERCSGAGCVNFSQIAAPTATSFSDTGLTASTSYSYRVRATDAAGNLSGYSNTATATTQAATGISLSVSPKRASVTSSQPQQFTATVTGDSQNLGVTWSVDGTNGGGTASGTISVSGLYTPSSSTTAGTHTISATSVADTTKSASITIAVTDLAGVLTFQNDNQRTGQNLNEYALTAATVTSSTFGSLFSCPVTEGGTVPGHIYAQPLYVANLTMADSKKHNVLFVATESDFVYAFDADANPCQQLWKASMLSTANGASAGETTVPAGDTGESDDLHPEIGITSTPVIDPATNTIYVCAKSKDSSANYHLRLHALSLITGLKQANSPMEITATGFTPLIEAQRPALLLSGTNVYLGFGSHGDQNNYHGYLLGYDKTSLAQKFVWSATDLSVGTTKGAIWQSGAGPAVDPSGDIWVETANGDFDTGTPRINLGDSVVRLNPAAVAPASPVVDFFTPMDQAALAAGDVDLGSGGVTILPDSVGSASHQHLALATGKTDLLYLLDQSNLGQFSSSADNIVQEVTLHNGPNSSVIGGMFSKAAYFNGKIYIVAIQDVLRAYSIAGATLTAATATGADTFGFPGATPSISAQGTTANGIVWVLNTTNNNSLNGSHTPGPAQLFAYDATTLNKLFSSATSGSGAAATAVKFTVPTVANGKVYVGGQGAVTVFGLLPN